MNAPLPAVFSIPERIFIISNGKKQRISPIVWNRAEKPGHRWQQVWDMQSATGVIPLRPARPPASTPIPRNSPGPHNRPIQPQNAISHTRRSFAKSKVRAPATRSKRRIPTGESWWGFSSYDLPLCLCQVLRSATPPYFLSAAEFLKDLVVRYGLADHLSNPILWDEPAELPARPLTTQSLTRGGREGKRTRPDPHGLKGGPTQGIDKRTRDEGAINLQNGPREKREF